MATHHRLPLFSYLAATFLLLVFLRAPRAAAQDEPPPWFLCGPPPASGSYTENSTYQANIGRLSATLPKNASASLVLFCTDSVGAVPDIVYALGLCRGDANASACGACLDAAFRGAQQQCPLYKDVIIFYDVCYLRFSNRNFLVADDNFVNTVTLQSSERVVGAAAAVEFNAAVGQLVNATADYTANSSRRFGTGEEGFDDRGIPTIYAMSQCAPSMTADKCRSCLADIIGLMPASFSGRKGGRILGVWCNYRYGVFPFFSGRPLLQLPAFSGTPPAPAPSPARGGKVNKRTGAVLPIAMPIIAAVLVITVICLCSWRRPAAKPLVPYSTSSDCIESVDSLLLDLSTLRAATDDFAESNMLGKGGFGMVHKGVLPDGQQIAVKRLCQSSRQGIGELKSELVLVAKLHHKNLVRLIGVCLEEQEKILVYEYMPNRSLDTILFDSEKNKDLDWGKRFKIINGIARGLQYLHEDSQLKIVHRDLKASNILLDFDYSPKISDFGLAKIFGGDQLEDVTHCIAGTYGYMAPEYAMRGQYSIKSDAFSFGVLVLEIVTGRTNIGSYNSEQDVDLLNLRTLLPVWILTTRPLPQSIACGRSAGLHYFFIFRCVLYCWHVWKHWTRGNVIELIDPSLSNHPPIDQMLKCIHIGLLCVQRKPADRPMMSSVNVMLSSNTVRLPSLSSPVFCIQEVSASDSSNVYSTLSETKTFRVH